MFENMQLGNEDQLNKVEVLNKLLDLDQIDIKTDLNIKQIGILCKLRWFKLVLNPKDDRDSMEKFEDVLEYFKVLMCSNRRKSRTEIIEAVSKIAEEEEPLRNLGQMFGNMTR